MRSRPNFSSHGISRDEDYLFLISEITKKKCTVLNYPKDCVTTDDREINIKIFKINFGIPFKILW
jgi:hypothetical protein